MAVIEKLRSKAGLLIGIVAFSLLAFVLGDFLTSNRSFLKGNSTTVGVIGGKKINVQDFESLVQTEIENYKLSQNKETVDNSTTDGLRDQAWNKLINDMVMGEQYKDLGISVSPTELGDMIKGKNIHPQIKQAFTDPKTGVFNPSSVINFLKNMDNDPTGKTKRQWLAFEKSIYDERLQQKYNDLIKNGLYIAAPEAKLIYEQRSRTANLKYVLINYNTIVDSTIQVSDAELNAVYERNIKKYKQEASRGIDYVMIDVFPSKQDGDETELGLKKLFDEFKTTKEDSVFVAANSDEPIDNAYHKKGTLDFTVDSIMFNSEVGTTVGPFTTLGKCKMAKLIDVRTLPDSVQARHILLKLEGKNKDDVMKEADSLKTLVKDGKANFDLLALQFSTDQGSKIKGGDLGWFGPGMMVPPFNDACFQGKVGDMPIVESQFGIHLIKIEGQKGGSKQVKVAMVTRNILPSSKTYQQFFQKANDFASKYNTAETFDKGITAMNLTKMSEGYLSENSRQVGSIENSRELVRWAFNNKKGDVSKAYEFTNKFVIAKIVSVKEKGTSTLEEVKDQVLLEARRDKKAEMLIEKIKKAGTAGSIEELAQKLQQPQQVANNFSFVNPSFPNTGIEPYIGGRVFDLKAGKLSEPLKGTAGVYIITVTDFTEPQVLKDNNEIRKQVSQELQQLQQRSQYEVTNALREKANIEDNRGKFY